MHHGCTIQRQRRLIESVNVDAVVAPGRRLIVLGDRCIRKIGVKRKAEPIDMTVGEQQVEPTILMHPLSTHEMLRISGRPSGRGTHDQTIVGIFDR